MTSKEAIKQLEHIVERIRRFIFDAIAKDLNGLPELIGRGEAEIEALEMGIEAIKKQHKATQKEDTQDEQI